MQPLPCPASSVTGNRLSLPGVGDVLLQTATVSGPPHVLKMCLDFGPGVQDEPPVPRAKRMVDGGYLPLLRPHADRGVAHLKTLGQLCPCEQIAVAEPNLRFVAFVLHNTTNSRNIIGRQAQFANYFQLLGIILISGQDRCGHSEIRLADARAHRRPEPEVVR